MTPAEQVSVLEHLKAVIELRFDAIEKELDRYREVIEHRLGVLNDHNQKIRDLQERTVPRETFASEIRYLKLMAFASVLISLTTLFLRIVSIP